MRRQSLLIVVLLCALNLSGWGGVLAAALCPHAAQMSAASRPAATTPTKTKGHASCHAEMDGSDAAGEAASHEAMDGMEAAPSSSSIKEESRALSQTAKECWHCIGHRSLPTEPVKTRDSQPRGGDTVVIDSHSVKPFAPPAFEFVSTIIPTQGAPPDTRARRHLLLNVFLI